MSHKRIRFDTLILARHLASSGKFKDVTAIETALMLNGKGECISYLEDPDVRDELNVICNGALSKRQRLS